MIYLMFVAGLVGLYFGGDWLVRGAVGIAQKFAVPHFVIGMTIVGFGTSMPELLVSVQAALDGAPAIAIGNIVGSNIANTLLILGVAAVLSPILLPFVRVRRDLVVALVATLLLWWMMRDAMITRIEGGVLFAGLLLFLASSFGAAADTEHQIVVPPILTSLLLTAVGLAALLVGARLLVMSSTEIARSFGISEAVIGLTIVAVGTSLPELAASISAARRGHAEIAVGNVIGSNIFNILGILGITALVTPIPVEHRFIALDLPVATAVAVALIAVMAFGKGVSRSAGIALLVAYAGYLALMTAG